MAAQVQCPNPSCGRQATIPEEQPGHTVRCPHCGTELSSVHGSRLSASATAEYRADPPPHAELPRQIGQFEIRARLGSGAFGAVYRAYDPRLEREVALKVAHPETLANPPAVERFLREAQAAAQLRHPHIVPVFEAGRDGACYYIASALITGRTLAETLRAGRLDFRSSARLVRDLAEALHHAHRLGIVHRDVKPANVMLDAEGKAYLMDFGLAHWQGAPNRLTRLGDVLGTPAYMAPEQAKGQTGEAVPASDQYSLGVVLYELLCGQKPFSGPPQLVLFNAIRQPPPTPRTWQPTIPPDLEAICLKALAKRPEQRYPDCHQLADALRRWLAAEIGSPHGIVEAETPATIVSAATAVDDSVPTGRRGRHWWKTGPHAWIAAALGVGLVGLAAIAMVIRINRGPPEQPAVVAATGPVESMAHSREPAGSPPKDGPKRAGPRAPEPEPADDLPGPHPADPDNNALRLPFETIRVASTHVDSLGLSPDGERLATAGGSIGQRGFAKLQDLASGRELADLDEKGLWVFSVAFHPDGGVLATGSDDGLVRLYDGYNGRPRKVLAGHRTPVKAVAFSPDGKMLASLSDEAVKLWDVAAGKKRPVAIKRHRGPVQYPVPLSIAFSPDGQTLAAGTRDRLVVLWDVATGKERAVLEGHKGFVLAVAFSPDGKTLASASMDHTAKIWDVARHRELRTIREHAGSVTGVAFSPDGNQLATVGGSKDRTVRLWDWRGGKQLAAFGGDGGGLWSVVFLAGGRILAGANQNGPRELVGRGRRPAGTERQTTAAAASCSVFSTSPLDDLHLPAPQVQRPHERRHGRGLLPGRPADPLLRL
ncbi:MAG TPA: protein kinase [Gemmataceae bacterium]|jgi:predicted Ser/Thr protein kinase|nr:protein kinase [Gemmataceae bacterium]